jgi:hypothetical protein
MAKNDVIFHFNKKFLEDPKIPMWIIKHKGKTHYVDHVTSEVGFSTKETPDNPHTFYIFYIFINKINVMSRKLTTEEFIKKAKEVHGDKYNYSKVEYQSNQVKVTIICPEHGEFEQRPQDHYKTKGCPECSGLKRRSTNEFIKDAKKVHNDKYDYSKVKFINVDTKIKIICPEHGEFKQTPYTHLTGSGCPKCRNDKLSKRYRKSKEGFIKNAKEVHGDKYDYSKVNYVNTNTKIKIICPEHGEFKQVPYAHLQSKGCPICKESKGEREVRLWLIANDINYIPQKRFKDCRNKRPLPFDFYLPEHNMCIEYDGKQHFSTKHGGFGANKIKTNENFKKLKINDLIKEKYCLERKINLLRISFTEDVNKVLNNNIR